MSHYSKTMVVDQEASCIEASSRGPILMKTSVMKSRHPSISTITALPPSIQSKIIKSRPISSRAATAKIERSKAAKSQLTSSCSSKTIEDFIRFKDAMDKQGLYKESKTITVHRVRN